MPGVQQKLIYTSIKIEVMGKNFMHEVAETLLGLKKTIVTID